MSRLRGRVYRDDDLCRICNCNMSRFEMELESVKMGFQAPNFDPQCVRKDCLFHDCKLYDIVDFCQQTDTALILVNGSLRKVPIKNLCDIERGECKKC